MNRNNMKNIKNMQKILTQHISAFERMGPRPLGSKALLTASDYLKEQFELNGLKTEKFPFECVYWDFQDMSLKIEQQAFKAVSNTYSPSCHLNFNIESIVHFHKLVEFENYVHKAEINAKMPHILMLSGDLTKEILFPPKFPFYTDELSVKIYTAIIQFQPALVIFVSHSEFNYQPLSVDSDFQIPSITIPPSVGAYILNSESKTISVKIKSTLSNQMSYHIIGRILEGNLEQKIDSKKLSPKKKDSNIKSTQEQESDTKKKRTPRKLPVRKKIIIAAHLDTMYFSSGAHDNTSGVLCLLLLASKLNSYQWPFDIEIVAFTSHELSGFGTLKYVQRIDKENPSILGFINIDAVGHPVFPDFVSLYNISDERAAHILSVIEQKTGISKGEPWYQGEHVIFMQKNIPCVVFCEGKSLDFHHTKADTFELLNLPQIQRIVDAILETLNCFS